MSMVLDMADEALISLLPPVWSLLTKPLSLLIAYRPYDTVKESLNY